MKRDEIVVALVVGGASSEREVSKLSGKGVLDALKSNGYKYKIIDPAYGINQPEKEEEFFGDTDFIHPSKEKYIEAVNSQLFDGIDIVFNALHGTWGEDGTIQALFELRGLQYTGSDVLASSISMNKTFTKVMFNHYGVNTPEWLLVDNTSKLEEGISRRVQEAVGFPCVIKPNNQGSAIGLTICHNESEVLPAFELAVKYSNETLIESYIEGYELTVGVIDKTPLPPLHIKPKHEFYDYTCKYTPGMSEYEVPANFPQTVLDKLMEQALYAYNSISCKGYGRIDFRLSKDHVPYCLEVNTLPGLTSTSLLPKAAGAAGIPFDELVDRIVLNSLDAD